MVAEGLRQALFPLADLALLAGVMASLVNDRETDEHLDKKTLPARLTKALQKAVRGLRGFAKHMQVSGFKIRPLF